MSAVLQAGCSHWVGTAALQRRQLRQPHQLHARHFNQVLLCPGRRGPTLVRAANEAPPGSSPGAGQDEDEDRVEMLESRLRAKSKPTKKRRRTQREEFMESSFAEWKEGKLFPEGWEDMSLPSKVWEIYSGERGMLFWGAKLAWWGIGLLAGGWIAFRFIGPALGLYELQNGLLPPPV